MGVLSEVSSGLVMFDDFHLGAAGNSNVLGGGWIEDEDAAADIRILEDGMGSGPYLVSHLSSNKNDQIRRTDLVIPDSFILQWNYGGAVADAFLNPFWHSNGNEHGGSVDHYDLEIRAADPDRGLLRIIKASAAIDSEGKLFGFDLMSGHRQGRIVHERDGANAKIRQYWANDGAAIVDVHEFPAGDLTQRGSELVDTPEEFNTDDFGFDMHDGTDLGYIFLCGWNIVITGLPSGHKIKLDSRAAIVEVGGVVTLVVDTFELPANTLTWLDASDAFVDDITPDLTQGRNGDTYGGGIWGGGIFLVSGVPSDPTALTCVCQTDQLAIKTDWTDNSSDEDGFRIERKIEGAADSTYQTAGSVGAGVVTFMDIGATLALAVATCYTYRVIAFNGDGDSTPTNEATCKTRQWSNRLVGAATGWTACAAGPATAWSSCAAGPATTWTKKVDPTECDPC